MPDEMSLVLESLRTSWLRLVAVLPRIGVALLLLLLGWVLARGVERLAVRAMRLARVDVAAERAGLEDFLLRGGVRFTMVTLIGRFLYWGLLLVTAMAVLDLLGLHGGPALVQRLGLYLPNVVVALAVLVFGSLVARFVRGVVEAYLGNIGMKGGSQIALLVQGALLAVTGTVALEQLGVAMAILASAFQLAFGGVCLALALAFGLGGRRWAEGILARTWPQR